MVERLSTIKDWANEYDQYLKNFNPSSPETFKIYIFPWMEINDEHEFRIFVRNRKIITLCSQKCYKKYTYESIPDELLEIDLILFQYEFFKNSFVLGCANEDRCKTIILTYL